MLQALGNAALARGADVEFVDHWPHTHHAAHRMERQIRAMAETLGLMMDVRRDGSRVFVQSIMLPNAGIERPQKPQAGTVGAVVGLREFLRERVDEIYSYGYICGFSEDRHFEEEVDIIVDWLNAHISGKANASVHGAAVDD